MDNNVGVDPVTPTLVVTFNILHPIQLNIFKDSHPKIVFPGKLFLPNNLHHAESLNNLLLYGFLMILIIDKSDIKSAKLN